MMINLLFWLLCFASLSFQYVEQSCKFKKEFPTLAGLNSEILKQLGTPLAIPKDIDSFSHELWLTCNPVYGAHLWCHKTIDSLAFMLKQSKNVKETSNQAKFINEMFSEMHSIHTIVNSNAAKTGYGRLAGHLFLFDLKKRKRISKGKSVGKTEKLALEAIYTEMEKLFPKKFTLEDLESLMESESQGEYSIPNFMTSMISAFVFADIDRSKNPKAAAELLKNYQTEFDKVLKAVLKVENLQFNPEKSLIHQDLDANIQVNSLFQDIFFAFCDSFVRSKAPKELHFTRGVTVKDKSWANCTEIAFTNLVMGAFYDPVNHFFKMQNSGIDEKLSGILAKTNGFESLISQSEVTECYQNLPFVLYNRVKIGEGQVMDSIDSKLIHFSPVPEDFYHRIQEQEQELESKEKIKVKGKLFKAENGINSSVFIINRQAFPNYFFFEVSSSPTNFMLLGYHMNFKNVKKVFTSASDIFELFLHNESSIKGYFQEQSAFGDCSVEKSGCSYSLNFSFGKLKVFSFHSIFEFPIQAPADSNDTFSKYYLLKTILDKMYDKSSDSLQKALWSISQKKSIDWNKYISKFQIPLLQYVEKVDFFHTNDRILDFAFENPNLWINAIQNSDLEMFKSSFDALVNEISTKLDKSILITELAFETDEIFKFKILIPLLYIAVSRNSEIQVFKLILSQLTMKRLEIYEILCKTQLKISEAAAGFILQDLASKYQQDEKERSFNIILYLMALGSKNYDKTIALWDTFHRLGKPFWKDFCDEFENSAIVFQQTPLTLYVAFSLKYGFDVRLIQKIADEEFDEKYIEYFKNVKMDSDLKKKVQMVYGKRKFFEGFFEAMKKIKGDE